MKSGGSHKGAAASFAGSYEKPFPAVAEISGHLAFYPDRVDRIEQV